MANDIINPWQTFRDDKGVPLAAGGIRVRQNLTSTLGTAFSDSALQTPQSVNPYRLDLYGRVQADLRWSGKRTIDVYNDQDEFIRRLNNVVTAVDTSTFAINFASVAAMAADTTLVAGDIAETQSYNADQDQGGARYIIEADTATVDNYLVIDLAPAGLQAKLLDIEENNSPFNAGAVGNGVATDSTAVQALLTVGGDIDLSGGTFLVDALTAAIAFRMSGNGTLLHSAFTTTDMLTLSGNNLVITFDGITIDGNSGNQSTNATHASIDSTVDATAGNLSLVSFNGVTFQNGAENDVRADATDAAATILFGFHECDFIGGLEALVTGPFLPSSIHLSDGISGLVEDCYFDLNTTPAVVGGRTGVRTSASGALTNPGYLSVVGNTFNRMGSNADTTNIFGAVHAQDVTQLIVGENRFLSPQSAAVVFGAEVDVVEVVGNMADGLSGTNVRAAITGLVTARAAPGNHWRIDANTLEGIAGVAINIDGASAGSDASNVTIDDNIIDSPTAQAILVENITDLSISGNDINLANAVGINAMQVDADGLSGVVDIKNNIIINVDGTAILATASASGAIYTVDGNTIESIDTAINVQNGTSAFIKNNTMVDASVGVIDVGTLTNAYLSGNSYTGTVPTNYARDLGSITNLLVTNNQWPDVDDSIKNVTGAALPVTADYHELTATAVTSFTFAADVVGFRVIIRATASVSITEGTGINLSASPYAMTDTDTLTAVWDGTTFQEVARSVN
ncbi:MAG: right-handed parallel beta-helix repeat-containing protein [Pseudohongiellaceae bacterium]